MSGHLYCPAEDGACFVSREGDCPAFEQDRYENETAQAWLVREDISAIESLSDAAVRSGDTQTAVKGYALALRLRSETGLWPQRRKDDPRPSAR